MNKKLYEQPFNLVEKLRQAIKENIILRQENGISFEIFKSSNNDNGSGNLSA